MVERSGRFWPNCMAKFHSDFTNCDQSGNPVNFTSMSTTEIIQQVQKLPPPEVFELGQWLRDYEASLWDQQIEADIRAGKLDKYAQGALAELREEKTRPIPE